MLIYFKRKVRVVKIGQIIKEQYPEVHKKLNKKKRRRGNKKEQISFSDIKNLMAHSCYRRGKGGAIKQVGR